MFRGSYNVTKMDPTEDVRLSEVTAGTASSVITTPPETNWKYGVSYFKNGVHSVDFILAWDQTSPTATTERAYERRKMYEKNLKEEGLLLEYDVEEEINLNFVKIHAPIDVLKRYAEVLKLRFPIKDELSKDYEHLNPKAFVKKHMVYDEGSPEEDDNEIVREDSFITKARVSVAEYMGKYTDIDKTFFPESGFKYTTTYSRDKEYLFDVNSNDFFTAKTRAMVVSFILERTIFGEQSQVRASLSFGIDRLLHTEIYSAAYALHDGNLKTPGSLRYTLFHEWAAYKKVCRFQPLDYVREYFGVKIALYFTWLGFYTCMLIPAAFVGLIVFLSGFSAALHDEISVDVCVAKNITMCPLCDKFCEFWKLDSACTFSRILSFFDNRSTPIFATFMSIWAVLFLELWKRYSAEITHRWGLTGYDDIEEVPRPQYLAKAEKHNKYKVNRVTGTEEHKIPMWRRIPALMFSVSVFFLLIALALAVCVGIIVYRMAVLTTLTLYGVDQSVSQLSSYILVMINITAAAINLVIVMALGWLCNRLSVFLTECEMPRTQTEFDDSVTIKMYLLEFVNYYSSIFYLAFVKGQYIGYPGHYNRVWGARQEECSIGGCLFDVTTQLAIIMVGKQIMLSVYEVLEPIVTKFMKMRHKQLSFAFIRSKPQWVQDYFLHDLNVFDEYLEMVLQFGFVTIFVSAFPLAPLCALINNLFECRSDAQKMLKYYRRPVARRVSGIGVWLVILDFVSRVAVFSNALIIGFTSEFIPHLVYRLYVSPDWTMHGYLDYSLSYMNVSELDASVYFATNETFCRYKDFREPPWSPNKYDKTSVFWTVLAARLIFVLIFENFVMLVVQIIDWTIPDVPRKLREKIRRETYIINNIIIDQAKKEKNYGRSSDDGHQTDTTVKVDLSEDSDGGHAEFATPNHVDSNGQTWLPHDISKSKGEPTRGRNALYRPVPVEMFEVTL